MSKNELFDDFAGVSAREWKQKIQADLKGADYNDTLIWQSQEDIKVKPFYTVEDLSPEMSAVDGPTESWRVGQKIKAQTLAEAKDRIAKAIELGAESIILELDSETLSIQDLSSGLASKNAKIYLDPGRIPPDQFKELTNELANSNSEVVLLYDIIGQLTATGNWYTDRQADMASLEGLDAAFGDSKWLSIDMSRYQNAGANRVQQLAYALSHAREYIDLTNTAHISLQVSVNSNYFFEIAKLRALRILWEKLCTEKGRDISIDLIAFPGIRNKTIYDYNVNMLRTTTECMSAILGGADTICNLPYDAIYNERNDFAERIARNQLLILKNESYFDKVHNPASGSYYIESLTAQLVQKAWALFEQIEAGGGFITQLKEHKIQKKIRQSAREEQEAFDRQEIVLVGSNKYPNENESAKNLIKKEAFRKVEKKKTWMEPITARRLSESLEKNRLEQE